jgi:hypothetical protein
VTNIDWETFDYTGVAGLAVDDWEEVIPSAKETTGLAFHYEAPSNVAPQAMLLAVPPSNLVNWDEALIENIVIEGLKIAKLRAVDSSALRRLGHLLPATFITTNVRGDTIGVDLERLTAT